MIKQQFLESLKNYTSNSGQQQTMWNEVEENYSKSDRHYHNLSHLNSLLSELKIYKDKFVNWEVIIFAIAYHDLVYNTLKNKDDTFLKEKYYDQDFKGEFDYSFAIDGMLHHNIYHLGQMGIVIKLIKKR